MKRARTGAAIARLRVGSASEGAVVGAGKASAVTTTAAADEPKIRCEVGMVASNFTFTYRVHNMQTKTNKDWTKGAEVLAECGVA